MCQITRCAFLSFHRLQIMFATTPDCNRKMVTAPLLDSDLLLAFRQTGQSQVIQCCFPFCFSCSNRKAGHNLERLVARSVKGLNCILTAL